MRRVVLTGWQIDLVKELLKERIERIQAVLTLENPPELQAVLDAEYENLLKVFEKFVVNLAIERGKV